MSGNLDVIILDDDPAVCEILFHKIKNFYTWGEVRPFTDPERAIAYCNQQEVGVAIFIIDVQLGREKETGFDFLKAVAGKFPMAYEDTIVITGNASDDIVDLCVSLNITYLVEKPIRAHTLQMAIRSIVSKYTKFAKRLIMDPSMTDLLNSM
jgi:DNA-binding NarL/FixJ family response regulator